MSGVEGAFRGRPEAPLWHGRANRRTFCRWMAAALAAGAASPVLRAEAAAGDGGDRVWIGRGRDRWCWPTPNPAFADGADLEAFIQTTGPENPVSSGTYGCVRNSGTRFHEGIDLFPLRRDRRGEPIDPVFAAAAGRVVYVNRSVGHSGYGRYVVLEHEDQAPQVITLYGHLRTIAPSIEPGRRVGAGEELGTMGRSAGGYSIPRDRAHLHFEIGFRLSDHFESFYASKRHEEPNHHGLYNGQNLLGVDPLAFFTHLRDQRPGGLRGFLASIPIALTLRVARRVPPDFLLRYPELLTTPRPAGPVAGWDIGLSGAGVPLRWTPCHERDLPGLASEGEVTILDLDTEVVQELSCRRLVRGPTGAEVPAENLLDLLRLMFGWH